MCKARLVGGNMIDAGEDEFHFRSLQRYGVMQISSFFFWGYVA